MIILLHGSDQYQIGEKIKEIISGYKKKNPSGINLLFLKENTSFKRIRDEGSQVAMFQEKKLIIGKDLILKREEDFLNNLDYFLKSDNVFLFQEGEKVKEEVLKKLEREGALIQKMEKLTGEKKRKWFLKEIEKRGGKIKKDALERLITSVGDDLFRGINEIEKLVNFKDKGEIEKEDVFLMVQGREEVDIFKAIDFLGEGRKDLALNFFSNHLKRGDTPLYLISMINYQVRNLIILKILSKDLSKGEAVEKSKLHPFVAKKSYHQAQNFTLSKLKKIYHKLWEVDLEIKTGGMEGEVGLIYLLSQF